VTPLPLSLHLSGIYSGESTTIHKNHTTHLYLWKDVQLYFKVEQGKKKEGKVHGKGHKNTNKQISSQSNIIIHIL
jgi:hypothetical protein